MVETNTSFERSWTTKLISVGSVVNGGQFDELRYVLNCGYSRVKKMVHLFQDPFHNMATRFHPDRRNIDSKNRPERKAWIKSHPNDPTSFQAWCKELGDLYKKEEYETFEYDMIKKVRLSPRHTELFKYIQMAQPCL